MSRLGDAFKTARKSIGLTGAEFADRLHLSPQFINDIEHGRRLPTPDRVFQFANQFPDVDSAEWLWLLLTDLWGEPTAVVMMGYARAVSTDCEEVGGDDPVSHPYQRRGSWSGDDWCAVEGCVSRASVHLSGAASQQPEHGETGAEG